MSLPEKRSAIMALEESMKYLGDYHPGDGDCNIRHYFAPGVYVREMWMPRGYLITGRIHKTEHICILSQGMVAVSDGGEAVVYKAPATIISKVGAKRAIYAYEESTWTNIHPTHLTDPEEIEREITFDTFEELDRFIEHKDE